jgi:long-chain acyl-CoA synthetase
LEINNLVDIYEKYIEKYREIETFVDFDGKKWQGISGRQFQKSGRNLSSFLKFQGIKKGDKVLLVANDRAEWHLSDYAILSIGAVVVPVYSTLNSKDTAFIAVHSDAKCAIVSSPLIADKLSDGEKWVGDLREVIVMEHKANLRREGLLYFDEALKLGEEILNSSKENVLNEKIDEDDIASIIYTSGTTGEIKGVILSHKNFVSNAGAVLERFELSDDDCALVFLPLAHSFERLTNYAYMWGGLKISYAESIDKLVSNMQDIKPTIICSVPRFFERVYVKIMENASSSSYLKRNFIRYGIKVAKKWAKLKVLDKKINVFLSVIRFFFDLTFYSKIRKMFGGRMRFFASGGAPLNIDLQAFFYGAGVKIIQGYGLTETSPILTADDEKIHFGSVGKPLSNVEIKIAEDGEILAKGPNVMKGYFKNEEETKESFTEDGFFKTGDIGHFDDKGRLFITDRKKEIIVTSQGKNIAPQIIESELLQNEYVSQAVVVGDNRPYLGALIYPNWENVIAYAERKKINYNQVVDLIEDQQIKHLFKDVLKQANVHLSRFERLRTFAILPEELTIEKGEITPTLKLKRKVILQKHKFLVNKMYSHSRIRSRA